MIFLSWKMFFKFSCVFVALRLSAWKDSSFEVEPVTSLAQGSRINHSEKRPPLYRIKTHPYSLCVTSHDTMPPVHYPHAVSGTSADDLVHSSRTM